MFEDLNFDVIFFEVCMDAKRFPHMTIHCIPLPKDIGHLAPMYFKVSFVRNNNETDKLTMAKSILFFFYIFQKAIMESETEWAHNKKLVDLSSKDVRRAVSLY